MSKKHLYILFYWLICALVLPNIGLSVTEDMSLWSRVANILLPLGVIGFAATLSGKLGRTIWLFAPLLLSAAFQTVLLALYGNGVISVDTLLNVLTTNGPEVRELLGNMLPMLIAVVILYCTPLVSGCRMIRLKIALPRPFRAGNRRAFAVIGLCGMLSLAVGCTTGRSHSVVKELYPVNVGYNIYLACDRTIKTARQHITSAPYHYSPRNLHADGHREVYVLVIGETSRASSWEIMGYGRKTNPRLSQRHDLLTAPCAMSESNTTHKSVPMLLSPVSATDYNTEIYNVKSLITAFKEAGFHTAFLSNQLPNHSFIDFFGYEADTTRFVREHRTEITAFDDTPLLGPMKEILAARRPRQLIVLHTYGSHFNYRDRYDRSRAQFLPDNYRSTDRKYKRELIKAYDNTILMTDSFLACVIECLEAEDCVAAMLYTSDHGEDLYEDGEHFLHASPRPSREQLHVPLLVWLSRQYVTAYPEVGSTLRRNFAGPVSTSRSFCPTALGIAGIRSDRIEKAADLTTAAYRPRPAVYLNDHNEPLPLTALLPPAL